MTYVPLPVRVSTTPMALSFCRAMRTVSLLTPKRRARSASDGSLSPTFHAPDLIWFCIDSHTSSDAETFLIVKSSSIKFSIR